MNFVNRKGCNSQLIPVLLKLKILDFKNNSKNQLDKARKFDFYNHWCQSTLEVGCNFCKYLCTLIVDCHIISQFSCYYILLSVRESDIVVNNVGFFESYHKTTQISIFKLQCIYENCAIYKTFGKLNTAYMMILRNC